MKVAGIAVIGVQLCFGLSLAAGISWPGRAAGEVKFVKEWGSFGSRVGQFHQPDGLAVTADGRVVVVDHINGRVQVFTTSGYVLAAWGKVDRSPGGFNKADGVAVNHQAQVIVAQRNFTSVKAYTMTGEFLFTAGIGETITDVALDSGDNIYVGVEGHPQAGQRIQKLAPDGSFLASIGSGLFTNFFPFGVAIDNSDNVLASDTWNHRIHRFNQAGELIQTWGANGTDPGQFRYPQGIAVDAAGNIYVVDTENHRVQAFDSSGGYLFQWGSYGQADGEFRFPRDIAIDENGFVYVSDTFNHRIQKFSVSLPGPGQAIAAISTTWGRLKSLYGAP